ncbi:TonB-dependent receptor [Duganella sp. BJB488]|uniref:TonB-dependent receptor plug domain-containing protein n=1 Tax=unclassified Duganella TaxID=2636909 RepID=UPI000E343679|nr:MULTISPECIES: TonB-dependent receptor [unclassified Duganella]RFP21878.1 TonB-dependent receptor [Duganella sp. BJB489]RFP23670.1 TonB-dependent receptor [Duganella sp. BJB488]RFP38837.1 TonB-dependent receptor [Duganella sp. BJB480]
MNKKSKLAGQLTVLASAMLALGASAQQGGETRPFELGVVVVTGSLDQVGEIGKDQVASVVSRKEMRQFNRDNVGDALNLVSGVTLSTNSRNEKTIAVRGFDARQVPLFIDGIPVYVPYDGYVDFARFTTADLASIQVAKGFSSMAYGPNTLGGAINLISRKPKAAIEGDATLGWISGRARQASANVGSNQGNWYMQAGVSYDQSDAFPLSSDFRPTATEDGGSRNNAYRRDSKVSLKFGLLPGAGDEYALSYYQQHGVKGQPPSTDPLAARYWKWPYWDKESLYFISRTALGASESLKLRAYHDNYGNEVDSYTNGAYSTLKTAGAGSVGTGRSIYSDWTNGASIELESRRLAEHTLRLISHYKLDKHLERDASATTTAILKDELVSYAVEDNIQLRPSTMLSLGAEQHRLRPLTVYSLGNPYTLPDAKTVRDWQAGLFNDLAAGARVYATVAQKSRLPTLKDRYSQRLGTYIENPALRPEAARNYEVGYKGPIQAAFFYSEIHDKIQAVANVSGNRSQMQNVGKVRASGIELGGQHTLNSLVELAANYTYTDLKNLSSPSTRLTDVPQQKLIAQALLHPRGDVDVIALAEHNSSRWASNTVQLAGFTTLNLKAAYRPARGVTVEAGVSNLGDRNYALADGFPSAGRQWFGNVSYQY